MDKDYDVNFCGSKLGTVTTDHAINLNALEDIFTLQFPTISPCDCGCETRTYGGSSKVRVCFACTSTSTAGETVLVVNRFVALVVLALYDDAVLSVLLFAGRV